MRLRFKRRRFGQIALTTSLGTIVESFRSKALAQGQSQSHPVSAQSTNSSSVIDVKLRVNGVEHALKIEPRVTLLDVLRERLNLTVLRKAAIMVNVERVRC